MCNGFNSRGKPTPKVSIIVPVYNVEPYIERCIDSILEQTYTDFELILVDDGSPDDCGAICDFYARQDTRVKVIHVSNGGVSHARNVGLEHVQGKYVTFVDSDDYCDKDYLQALLFNIEKKNADIVQSGYIIVNDCYSVLQERSRRYFDIVIGSDADRVKHLIENVLYYGNGWEVWSSMFVNELIQKNRIRFCETCENYAEDLCFMLEYLLYCNRAVSIEESHYCYVQHSGSMMDRSKQLVRLNPLNEVGIQFGKRFFGIIKDKEVRAMYPLLYHLIMSNQYRKMSLKGTNRKKALSVKGQIKNINWHDKWMRRLVKNKVALIELYGEKEATEKILTARLLANRNWYLFKLEKYIAFQVLRVGEKNATN